MCAHFMAHTHICMTHHPPFHPHNYNRMAMSAEGEHPYTLTRPIAYLFKTCLAGGNAT